MFLGENEVIPFQKSPWDALCKNGILFKYLFFKLNLKTIVSNIIVPLFCTNYSPLMLQKSLGYAIIKFQSFYIVPEKIVIFKKITKFEVNIITYGKLSGVLLNILSSVVSCFIGMVQTTLTWNGLLVI